MSTKINDKPVRVNVWADSQVQRAIRTIIKRYGLGCSADAVRLACVLVAEADGPILVARQQPASPPHVGRRFKVQPQVR